MGYKRKISERERGIWRAALTLANNICVQESDRHNDADETREARTASQCAARVREYIDSDDESLALMFDEAGVPEERDPLGEALNSGDGAYRP